MNLYVTREHKNDLENIVGEIYAYDGAIVVNMSKPIKAHEIPIIFGNISYNVILYNDLQGSYIKMFRINGWATPRGLL